MAASGSCRISLRVGRRTRQIGYYPGYDILAQQDAWDEATRRTVLDRLKPPPPLRYFTLAEGELLRAICDRILPQDDRDPDQRIPILQPIDHRLADNIQDGYRYAGMPPDGEAYRLGLRAMDEISRHMFGRDFLALANLQRDSALKTIHDGSPPAAGEIWRRMPVKRFWQLLVNDVIRVYYAHPWAWNEIGYGGPAYPRGYMRLEGGQPEPWEVHERRHAWSPPEDTLSALPTDDPSAQTASGRAAPRSP
jgi:hypothetical protein